MEGDLLTSAQGQCSPALPAVGAAEVVESATEGQRQVRRVQIAVPPGPDRQLRPLARVESDAQGWWPGPGGLLAGTPLASATSNPERPAAVLAQLHGRAVQMQVHHPAALQQAGEQVHTGAEGGDVDTAVIPGTTQQAAGPQAYPPPAEAAVVAELQGVAEAAGDELFEPQPQDVTVAVEALIQRHKSHGNRESQQCPENDQAAAEATLQAVSETTLLERW